ncbi:MAG: pyridine nucleotide-disulfide oxidoreductase, partial [Planctomycetota bacterium]|nr:pyridine nucleotide-disulfide oxidoreductase [Planctomycetota bacterium]
MNQAPTPAATDSNPSFDVLIVGAGTGGVTVGAMLRRLHPSLSVGIIDPADTHYYQPLWTLVGGGEATKEASGKPIASLIPPGAQWIQGAVTKVLPEANRVQL